MKKLESSGKNWKMRRTLFWAGLISILVVIEVFSLLDFAHRRQVASREAQLLSELTAARISAALSRNEVPAAVQILKRLNAEQRVTAACLYAPDGRVLDCIHRSGSSLRFIAPPIRPDGIYPAAGFITSFRSIRSDVPASPGIRGEAGAFTNSGGSLSPGSDRSDRRVLGTLYIEFDVSGFFESWEPLARFAVLLAVLCLAAAVLLSRRMQRAIADPILDLTRTALRVASEKQYRNLFDQVPDPVFIVDRESYRFVYANQTASRSYGYGNEEFLRMTPIDLHGPDDRRSARPDFDDGTSAIRFNSVHETRDGRRLDVEILSNPIVYEDRPAWLTIARDVTTRNEAQEELERAKSAAEEASRAKSVFLANMSHEIRTPMNGIFGMLDLALDSPLSGEQREFLALAKSSADSLLSLLNDILDFSKIEAGKLEFENIVFSLRDDLGEKIKSLGHLASRKGIELIWRVRPDVPDWLVGDPGRLRQILFNLVGNAIKFTEKGEVLVDIWREEDLTSAIRLHFLIRDTGIGIPAEQQERIFDAFTQADSSTTRRFGGTGLGLAVVKRLVERMDGRIWVKSELGNGSSFHFTGRFELPAPDVARPPRPQPAAIEGLRVLVADDHPESRLILIEMLRHWRMAPEETGSLTGAYQALRRAAEACCPFQLAIIDAELPKGGGLDLAEWIGKNRDLDSKRIILFGSLGNMEKWQSARAGAYLNKPVQQSELLDAIARVSSGYDADASAVSQTRKTPPIWAAGKRVLLAEDNAVNQWLAARVLEKLGYLVTTANDGGEVLELHSRRRFDMILMDVQMPAVDGLDATRMIREKERTSGAHVPIVILTAHAMKGDRERCLAAGADDYLAKPIAPAQISAVLERIARADSQAGVSASSFTGESERIFDLDVLLERLEGDRTLLAEMVRLFEAAAPAWMAQARAELDCEDFPALRRTAHTLKGAIGNFGASPALSVARTLEEAAYQGSSAVAATALRNLEEELKRLSECFEPARAGILR